VGVGHIGAFFIALGKERVESDVESSLTEMSTTVFTARQRAAAAQRIVIKLGTNVIMRDDGAPAVGLIHGLVESAINLRREGREVIFVSSGAIAHWE
jgi:hypothetical protein